MVHRASVLAMALVAAAASGCGGASPSPPSGSGASSPSASSPQASSDKSATATTSTIPTPASTVPSPTQQPAKDALATINKAMLTVKQMRVVDLEPASDPLVLAEPGTWFITCNVTLTTDAKMLASGHRTWTQHGRTVLLENLALYPPGMARQALAEAAKGARSCSSFDWQGTAMRVIAPVKVTDDALTFCQKGPNNVNCVRTTVRGDYISQVFAFGSGRQAAQELTDFVAGMARASQESAGL